MNSQKFSPYKFLFLLLSIILILIGCAAKNNIKTSLTSNKISPDQNEFVNQLTDIKLTKSNNQNTVTLQANNSLTYTIFKLSKPDRILVDLQNLTAAPSLTDKLLKNECVTNITWSDKQYNNEKFLRLEISLSTDMKYNASSKGNLLNINISPKENLLPKNSPSEEISKPKSNTKKNKTITLREINISKNENDKITIETSTKTNNYSTYTLNNPNRIIINLNETKNALKSNVIYNRGEIVNKIKVSESSNKLSVVVELTGDTFPLYQVSQQQQTLNITFENKKISTATEDTTQKDINEKDENIKDEDTEINNYTGEKISLDFKDADIKNILRLIADISGKNIIISDNAKGKITLKLEDIPWDEALDIILESHNLGKIVTNTVTRIESREQIKRINDEKLLAKKSEENIADLIIKSYSISYAKANNIASFIKKMGVLSERGSVNSFELTNKVTVQDIEENIPKVENLIREQDVATRQVLIEAKIVQSNPTFLKELGVQWTAALSGDIGAAGDSEFVEAGVRNLAGVANGFLNFGYLSDTTNLDATLNALQNEGELKILSSPKVLGLDNTEARIKQGVALPYLELSEEGVTSTEFKDMVLELKVTPKITAENTISIHVFVTKNQPSSQTGVGGEPGIDVREIETDLLIESAKTIVIGGIYETTTQTVTQKVPFFGDLPLVKRLFRFEQSKDELQEMLVFLTVTIVERPSKLEG